MHEILGRRDIGFSWRSHRSTATRRPPIRALAGFSDPISPGFIAGRLLDAFDKKKNRTLGTFGNTLMPQALDCGVRLIADGLQVTDDTYDDQGHIVNSDQLPNAN
jgi:hypothetical protein